MAGCASLGSTEAMQILAIWLELREETAQEFNFHTGKILTLLLNFLRMKKEEEEEAGDKIVLVVNGLF
jgi:hypothetical protein